MALTNTVEKLGVCEVCERSTGSDGKPIVVTRHYGSMWFCIDCWRKESEHIAQHKDEVVTKVDVLADAVAHSKRIDEAIAIRTDIFTAATVAIQELQKNIEANPQIENKPYALAEHLVDQFNHWKQVAFEANQAAVEAGNQQKAIQVYLNTLANQLRAEEREKLKIHDINYKPSAIKPSVKKVTTSQTKKSTKLDKVELRKCALELGVSEFTLQMVCVQKGLVPSEAAKLLKQSIELGKQNSGGETNAN